MNTNTRYILTATAAAGGLFFVGATANAIVGDNKPASATIGEAVEVPAAEVTPDVTVGTAPEVVEAPEVLDLDDGLDTGGWGFDTSPTAHDDDDDEHDDEHDDDEHDDEHDDDEHDDNEHDD